MAVQYAGTWYAAQVAGRVSSYLAQKDMQRAGMQRAV
jgi:hypothetical protein